jgi:predicted glycosyl hydrolase (DUF1957 family)
MLTLDQIQKKLADRNLNMIARETGLAYDTVWRIAKKRAKQPTYDAIKRISDYLEANA